MEADEYNPGLRFKNVKLQDFFFIADTASSLFTLSQSQSSNR